MECMQRAMYFESVRSSREGMIAVGSVVMNRVNSGQYPRSVCGVVGQKNQFAPGVLTKPMSDRSVPLVREAARAVMRGERHPQIGNAMFFHAANRRFGYDNMHYVLVAGGNAFYEKRRPELVTQPVPPQPGRRAGSGGFFRLPF
ncbi:MAG: cell wall hydrolase [Paracoccus sp. (in: a-proteobacteria)]